jgi:spore coat polysaccharide biosynthesis protein SpsF
LCSERGYAFYRGSHLDVLDRYYQAARQFEADVIVRLTADCPLIDPEVINHVVHEFLHQGVDFAANRLPPPLGRTFPIGLDVEVCKFGALERAWKEANLPYQREHVMPYLYEQEGRFKILLVNHDPDYGHLRWTVDTPEDLEVIRRIFAHFNQSTDFSWTDILALYHSDPSLAAINAQVRHKGYRDSGV